MDEEYTAYTKSCGMYTGCQLGSVGVEGQWEGMHYNLIFNDSLVAYGKAIQYNVRYLGSEEDYQGQPLYTEASADGSRGEDGRSRVEIFANGTYEIQVVYTDHCNGARRESMRARMIIDDYGYFVFLDPNGGVLRDYHRGQ